MAVYTRQSSSGIVDGGTIEASDLNAEFDQLASAFLAPTFGVGTSGTDIVMTFDGESADGVITWMEDEDYFKFSDDMLLNSTEKLMFNDTGTYIYSNADGDLDIVSDGTAVDSINLESAGGITLDAGTAGSGIIYEDDGTEVLRIFNSSSDVTIQTKVSDKDLYIKGNDGGSDVTALTFDMSDAGKATFGGNVVVTGDLTISGDDLTMGTNTSGYILVADGTNYNPVAISGDVTMASTGAVTIAATSVENSMLAGSIADSKLSTISTADKVAGGAIQIDSGTDGTSITIADTDKFLIDDGGTTKYINASQINSYVSAAVAADDIATGDSAVTIATSSGNITIDAQAGDADIIFKGTDSSSDITALTLDMSEAGKAIFNSDVTVGGDLTVTGDDITMGTNTSGAALIADGTNFNPVVISGDASIATNGALTIANDAIDSQHYADGSIDTAHIADDQVTLAKMAGLARGKIIYGDSSGNPAALALGSNGQVLKSDGTDISWGAQSVSSLAADDLSTGDAAVTIATSAGDITIDAQGNDTDIIFKGTDGGADTTFLTLDGSDGGTAVFNHDIRIADGGQIGSASDADAIAIASDGVVTMNQIPVFSAGINVSGGNIAGTLSTAAQANITSLGTLTALTVDDVAINGKVMTMTGSTDDTAVFTVGTNGTLTIETTDTAAAAGNIQITADGTAELAGTTVTLDSGADIVLDAAGNNVTFKSAGTSILDFSNSSSDAVITASVQDKDIIFKGDDGGSAVTALTMDMSAAGKSIFGAGAVGATQTANASGSTTLDFDTYQNFVLTATGNVTLANPSTESVGQSGVIVLIQDGTGSRTLSTGTDYEWPAGTAGTISTAASAVDVIPYFVDASNSILLGAPQLAFATPS
tara:strand:- start:135 stop:2774 length:2640 start_codon:yes stop_codon:yes gene_type:complete